VPLPADPNMLPTIDATDELLTLKTPPIAALIPPPTNVAVIAAFVMSATFTSWSMVTVKLLE
jgi:hypothetical protein